MPLPADRAGGGAVHHVSKSGASVPVQAWHAIGARTGAWPVLYNGAFRSPYALSMIVLGVESSCDETGLALYDTQRGLLSHALHSQVAMHEEYGGVVPELASRDHIRRAIPLLEAVLVQGCLLYTSPSPRDRQKSRMPSSA